MHLPDRGSGVEYTHAYDVTFWGRRDFLEPLVLRISEAPGTDHELGWLQVLLDLLEEHDLKWREYPDPGSGWPFAVHKDGMPPVPLSELRATKPVVSFGHSPFTDRSNLGLKFSSTQAVGILLEVVVTRVPGFANAEINLTTDDARYQWWSNDGNLELRFARAVES